MAFTPPATGGLHLTVGSINIGIWWDTSLEGALGSELIAARLDPTGWIAFWQAGAQQDTDWQTQVTAAGGIVNLIKTFLPAINTALSALITPAQAPTPTTPFTPAAANAALLASFSLTLVNGVPVMAAL